MLVTPVVSAPMTVLNLSLHLPISTVSMVLAATLTGLSAESVKSIQLVSSKDA